MSKILLLISLFVSLFAYNPTEYVNQQENYIYQNDQTSIKLKENADLIEPEPAQTEVEQAKQAEEIVKTASEKTAAEPTYFNSNDNTNFFVDGYEFPDTSLVCPPTKDPNFTSLIESIDFNTGTITCKVVTPHYSTPNMSQELKKATPFSHLDEQKLQTFTNKKYVEMLKQNSQNTADLIDPAAKEAAGLYAQKMQLAKQTVNQNIQNTVNGGAAGSVYLNLSQIIDAVMVFDQQIINIEQSLKSNDIVLNPPYVQSYKAAHVRKKLEENNKLLYEISAELNSKWSALPVFFDPKSENSIEQKKSDAYQVLGSGLNKILFFIVKYYDIFNHAVWLFLFGAIVFATYNVSHYFFERFGNENERKNLKYKAVITGFSTLMLLFLTMTETTYKDESGLRVELSTLQGFVGVLSQETNYIANKTAEAVIDSYSGGMFTGSSVMSPAEIERVAQDHKKREVIKEYQSNHMPRCYNMFNVDLLRGQNSEAYKNNGDNVFISFGQVKQTPNVSPYNTVSNGGFVQDSVNWFSDSTQKYSFDACAQLEKDYKLNLLKLQVADVKIANFNDIDVQDRDFEGKEAIMNKIWLSYQQYGYVALPLIAVSDVYEKVWNLPKQKAEQYIALLTDFDMKESVKFISENVLFHYAIGSGLSDWAASKYKIMTDALFGWIPFGIGANFSSFGSAAMGFITSILVVDTLVDLLTSLRGLFIFGISTVMLFLIFIAKFTVFWGVPFFIIYAFLAQSIEKTSRLVVKTILTFFKPVILIFVIFLTLFVMDFFHNMMLLFLDEMAVTMSGEGGYIETIIAYVLKNVGHIFAIIIEFIVAFQLVVKGTSTVYSFFEQSSNDISDVIADGVASTMQNKVIK